MILNDDTKENELIKVKNVELYSKSIKLFLVNNITEYTLSSDNFQDFIINTASSSESLDKNTYLIVDLYYHNCVGHWIYESGIYLSLFNILKKEYNNLKLVLKEEKTYKKLFCRYFNILDNSIIYDTEINSNNLCIIPSPITALNLRVNKSDLIELFFIEQHKLYNKREKLYKYIVLPRQTKENYINTENTGKCYNIINYLKDKNINHYILNTDTITDIKDQIDLIEKSENIIIHDGSALLINGLFTKNSNIYVCERLVTQGQAQIYPYMKNIINSIQNINNNKIIYFPTEHDCIQRIIQDS